MTCCSAKDLTRLIKVTRRSSMNSSKSFGVNGSLVRISKARREMKCDSKMLSTVASPFLAMRSGRYSLGRRSLMTSRLGFWISGVRFRIVSIGVRSAYSAPRQGPSRIRGLAPLTIPQTGLAAWRRCQPTLHKAPTGDGAVFPDTAAMAAPGAGGGEPALGRRGFAIFIIAPAGD